MQGDEKPRQPMAVAFRNALAGIKAALKERNMRIHCVAAAAAILTGIGLRIDWTALAVVVLCIALVLSLECVNTALEAVVDLASPEYHELARVAKDCAAGAVLIAAVCSVVVGLLVFVPAIICLL